MRLCDSCGTKIPRFQPRTNQNGQMLCNGCAEGKPGAPGRPIGLHGSKDDQADRIFMELREALNKTASEDMAEALENARQYGVRFGQENLTAYSPDHHPSIFLERELAEMKAKFEEDKRRFPQLADRLDQAQMEGVRDWDNFNRPWQNKSRPDVIQDIGTKTAHDSGDGATIYHCPFCGGGQVVAGSDGSVECGYCHTLFTVQIQPEHAAMPQTIDGVPQDIPGMPGEVGGLPEGGAGPVPGASPATDTGTDGFVPPDAFAPPPAAAPAAGAPPAPPVKAARLASADEPEAATKACDNFKPGGVDGDGNRDPYTCSNCFWTIGAHDAKAGGTSPVGEMPKSSAYYLNANGVALDEDAFLRHLAIAFADDPAAVIDQVRQERAHV